MVTIKRWNILEHLDSEEEIAGYLDAALEECAEDARFLVRFLAKVAQARVINQIAKETDIDRKDLCALFLDGGENQDAPPLAPDVAERMARAFIAPAHAAAQA
jgi:probable addiction module antidote protein